MLLTAAVCMTISVLLFALLVTIDWTCLGGIIYRCLVWCNFALVVICYMWVVALILVEVVKCT